MLPEEIKKKNTKIIHISRDPRDIAVSYFHFCQMNRFINYKGSWNSFFRAFMEGEVQGGSWFEYQREWMENKDNPNILFIEYEKLLTNTADTVNRMAHFIGKPLEANKVDQIAEIVSFKSMKNNPTLNRMELPFYDKSKEEFLRSGKTDDWKYILILFIRNIFYKLTLKLHNLNKLTLF